MMRNDYELTEIVINAFLGTKSEISSECEGVNLSSLQDLQTIINLI
jgi:hypothetical protein